MNTKTCRHSWIKIEGRAHLEVNTNYWALLERSKVQLEPGRFSHNLRTWRGSKAIVCNRTCLVFFLHCNTISRHHLHIVFTFPPLPFTFWLFTLSLLHGWDCWGWSRRAVGSGGLWGSGYPPGPSSPTPLDTSVPTQPSFTSAKYSGHTRPVLQPCFLMFVMILLTEIHFWVQMCNLQLGIWTGKTRAPGPTHNAWLDLRGREQREKSRLWEGSSTSVNGHSFLECCTFTHWQSASLCLIGMEMSQQHLIFSFLFLEAHKESKWGFELFRNLRCFFPKHKYSAYSACALSFYIFSVFYLLSMYIFFYHDNGSKR